MSWSKLFSDIVCSSIWNEDDHTRIVWVTMLAIKGPNHIVRATVGGLAHQARVPLASCQAAIGKLSSPDPDGVNQPYEGRRIQEVEHGWLVLNGETYKNRRDETYRKEYQADWVKAKRLKEKLSTQSVDGVDASTSVDTSRADKSRADKKEQKNGAHPPPQPLNLDDLLSELKPIYPHIDLDLEKSKIRGWMIANPGKRKLTRKFVVNWLNRVEKPLLDLSPTVAAAPKKQFVTYEMVADWCARKRWTKLTETAWGKLMGGTYYGRPITNEVDFNAAMSAIYEETEP